MNPGPVTAKCSFMVPATLQGGMGGGGEGHVHTSDTPYKGEPGDSHCTSKHSSTGATKIATPPQHSPDPAPIPSQT